MKMKLSTFACVNYLYLITGIFHVSAEALTGMMFVQQFIFSNNYGKDKV